MILIAHRGLMNGPDPDKENNPEQIDLALSEGFDVEVDVRWIDGKWWLGHDEPRYSTSYYFLKRKGIWIHCKNVHALERLAGSSARRHYFWHQTDCYTLTSKGIPWVYPGKQLLKTGVCVLPEETMTMDEAAKLDVYGICSDYVMEIREKMKCQQ